MYGLIWRVQVHFTSVPFHVPSGIVGIALQIFCIWTDPLMQVRIQLLTIILTLYLTFYFLLELNMPIFIDLKINIFCVILNNKYTIMHIE